MNRKKWILIVLAVILVAGLVVTRNPRIRTYLFVMLYHEQIEEGLKAQAGVPADDAVLFGYQYVNSWEGQHPMTEFLISGSGFGSQTAYYGCYYSPDDVPLAFQNMAAKLTQCGHDAWKWTGAGDNRGKTIKIMDHWYYFEASF